MKIKVLILIFGIFTIQFIASCCRSVQYYDFTEMTYELSNTIINQDEELSIELFAADVEYISSNLSDLGFSNALAFDCDDGWGGMKYPFEEIEITSSSNFNNDFSSNENLISLFQIRKFLGNGEFEFVSIEEINLEEIQTINVELLLTEKPTIDESHVFTIKMVKSNEEEIIIEIEEISWQ